MGPCPGGTTGIFLAHYAPGIRKYSVDGRRLTGTAYGWVIFGTGERPDQWRSVATELRNDPDTKRAVLQILRGEELTVPGNPDVSCTLALQFLSREGPCTRSRSCGPMTRTAG